MTSEDLFLSSCSGRGPGSHAEEAVPHAAGSLLPPPSLSLPLSVVPAGEQLHPPGRKQLLLEGSGRDNGAGTFGREVAMSSSSAAGSQSAACRPQIMSERVMGTRLWSSEQQSANKETVLPVERQHAFGGTNAAALINWAGRKKNSL